MDHYVAKEFVEDLAQVHEKYAGQIERIEIIASESIGVEGRGNFYEQTGALRDIIQGHLLQLLALTLMDIPHDFDWDELPRLRLRALEQIIPADPALAIRAQYEGYQDEVDNPGSLTETFVSVQLQSTQPRWLDVPITITAGKALPEKRTEIRIHLKKMHEAQSNCITFRIQPDEGVGVELFVKKPGYEQIFDTRELGFTFTSDDVLPDAYEHVLVDATRSRKSLFTTSEEVLQSWRIVAPLQHAWDMGEQPLVQYKKGTFPHI
jgi:glucose-6-phosphate 1-dehydrogenase